MPTLAPSQDLESALVRRSVGALKEEQQRCHHCHRTPLFGEFLYAYSRARGREDLVCELCRPLRTARPDRTIVVHSQAQGTVRAFRASAT
jgi:hypothetical protein